MVRRFLKNPVLAAFRPLILGVSKMQKGSIIQFTPEITTLPQATKQARSLRYAQKFMLDFHQFIGCS
jgi:hypothetical protein